MATILNDLWADGIEVSVFKDDTSYVVDIKYVKDDGKYEDGEYLGGFTDLATEEEAEFLARAYIAGFKQGKEV